MSVRAPRSVVVACLAGALVGAAVHVTLAQDAPRVFAGTQLDEPAILEPLQRAPVTALRSIGNTSTVFKVTLPGEIDAAYKVVTVKRPRGPHAEVAAYRLARLLGMRNVPPAIARRLPVSLIREQMQGEQAARWPELEATLTPEPNGRVLGAMVYWVDKLEGLGLETPEGQTKLAAWLSIDGELPSEQRELAAQVSSMIAFDYLVGNWDRWSGGNVKGDATGKVLYVRDNDAAFAARLSEPLLRRMLEPLLRTQRFSRSFYLALRSLTRESLRAELAQDPGFAPGELLDDARIEGLFDRRETVLSHILASIELHGEVQVLAFP
jgi:hypothetical protein